MAMDLTEFLKTGHARIDAAHQRILDAVEAIRSALNDNLDDETLRIILDDFVALCQDHFFDEESILSRAGYPHVAEHARYHSKMLDNARTAQACCLQTTNANVRLICVEDMISYVIDDIVRSDMTFAPFLEARGLCN